MTSFGDFVTDERSARVLLSMITVPDDPMTGRLVAQVGAVDTVRLIDAGGPLPGASRVDSAIWLHQQGLHVSADALSDRLAQLDQSDAGLLVLGDPDWPAAMGDLGFRAPLVLWTRGATSLLHRPLADLVTMTGSRASTSYGNQVAGELAADSARDGHIVVGGGGFGIEAAAHRAAMGAGGDTVAVMAGGVDRAYPSAHADLLSRIADTGLLVSEAPPGSAPSRSRFVARARLMAALSGATVVVEAGARSGALRVASQARLLGRAVGAVPGPVVSAVSTGPHNLLWDHTARIVTNLHDVTTLLDGGAQQPPRVGLTMRTPPTPTRTPSPGL